MASIRHNMIALILDISGELSAFDILENTLNGISVQALSANLLECGVIPEQFEASSSEEKLWAKYCDILLARTWSHLGIPSEVLRTRGDSADVFGRTADYSIIGDAKAFRLSRTAKNQKDFKISALDDWRKNNTYACLVAPLFQYPISNSQIYFQAIQRNVTLLSYIHLKFLLDHFGGQDLSSLWNVATMLSRNKNAVTYWETLDKISCNLIGQPLQKLQNYKLELAHKTKEIGLEGIQFWQAKISEYQGLSQQEAVLRLIRAEKIEAKIETIRQAINFKV